MTWPHTGAALTGGDSSRMGSWKGDLRLPDGTTLGDRVVEALRGTCAEVVAAGRPFGDLRQVSDLRPGSGPLGGIESLLRSGVDNDYLVCAIDTPLLTPTLLRMLTGVSDAAATIFTIEGDSHTQSLPLRISAGVADDVSKSLDQGRNAIHQFLQTIEVETVTLSHKEGAGLANVNSPEDLARIARG